MFDYEAEAYLELWQVAMIEVFTRCLTESPVYASDDVFQGATPYK